MTPFQTFEDVVEMLRRRALQIGVVFVLGSLISLAFAASREHLYRSSEVLQIAQQQISDDLARSTVEGSSARRLQLVEQQLMARDNVLDIVRKYRLYKDIGAQTEANLIFLLRSAVTIEGVAAAREGSADDGTISVLRITAEMPTAEQAQIIAREFSQRTIDLAHQARLEQAEETLTFIARQEGALVQELEALEEELVAYRLANNVALGSSIELRAVEIIALNEGLLDIARERIEVQREMDLTRQNERPATAQRLLADLQDELDTLDAQRSLLLERRNELEAVLETTPEVESRLAAYDRRLDQIREQLLEMRSRRTEAEIGYRLEAARQGQRLTVLEAAPLPDHPFTTSRKFLLSFGMAASFVLALAIAIFLEFRDPVLRTAARMEEATGLKPVVTIPQVRTSGGGWLRRFRRG